MNRISSLYLIWSVLKIYEISYIGMYELTNYLKMHIYMHIYIYIYNYLLCCHFLLSSNKKICPFFPS